MTDLHGNPAFVDVKEYTDATSGKGKYTMALNGEIGAVGPFRLVVHPNAIVREGAGAAVTNNNAGLRETGGNYDVYPCLVVGSEAFTHIGFEFGAGTKGKFKVSTKMPEENRDRQDPFGKVGFTAIEFWNGVLVDRPEWIAVYNVGAKLY
jgi:N4-gp56 family major capsid protein